MLCLGAKAHAQSPATIARIAAHAAEEKPAEEADHHPWAWGWIDGAYFVCCCTNPVLVQCVLPTWQRALLRPGPFSKLVLMSLGCQQLAQAQQKHVPNATGSDHVEPGWTPGRPSLRDPTRSGCKGHGC